LTWECPPAGAGTRDLHDRARRRVDVMEGAPRGPGEWRVARRVLRWAAGVAPAASGMIVVTDTGPRKKGSTLKACVLVGG
jgi:hypothetical protein